MSKFKQILNVAQHREPVPVEQEDRPPTQAAADPAPAVASPKPSTTSSASPSPAPFVLSPAPKRGRPPGKKSDPAFVQVSSYIPSELHHGVKLALLQERQGREFSELVAELLDAWLQSRT